MRKGWVFCFVFVYFVSVSNSASASPIFITTSNIWDETTTLLVGNCNLEFPHGKTIKQKDGSDTGSKWLDLVSVEAPHTRGFDLLVGYQEFKLKNKRHDFRIFGLWGGGISKKGVLSLIEGKTYTELTHFDLPFEITRGVLTLCDAYYKNDWHTLLVLTAKDELSEKSFVLVFEVTDPTKPLEPFIHYQTDEFLVSAERPVVVRLSNGRFGIAMVGSLNRTGSLQIILFDEPNPMRFAIEEKNLSFLVATDLIQRGFVDRMYVAGERALWALDFTDCHQVSVKKLADANLSLPPIVIPDPKGFGVWIYFLGQALKEQGFFMVQDPLKPSVSLLSSSSSIKLIIQGNFRGFFARFGHFILVHRDLSLKPWAIELPHHHQIPITWHTIYSNEHSSPEVGSNLIKLIWDPKNEKEILLILNSSCQLNILAGCLQESKYGRILWRKIQE